MFCLRDISSVINYNFKFSSTDNFSALFPVFVTFSRNLLARVCPVYFIFQYSSSERQSLRLSFAFMLLSQCAAVEYLAVCLSLHLVCFSLRFLWLTVPFFGYYQILLFRIFFRVLYIIQRIRT